MQLEVFCAVSGKYLFKKRPGLSFLLGKNADKMLGLERSWDGVMEATRFGCESSKWEEGGSLVMAEPPKQPSTAVLHPPDFVEVFPENQTHMRPSRTRPASHPP